MKLVKDLQDKLIRHIQYNMDNDDVLKLGLHLGLIRGEEVVEYKLVYKKEIKDEIYRKLESKIPD